MRNLIRVVIIAVCGVSFPASAQFAMFQTFAPIVVPCSNTLDLSDSCNSQYITVI